MTLGSGRFKVILEPRVEKLLSKLEAKTQLRIRIALRVLGKDPRPPGARKLARRDGYRVRVGDYRILYEVQTEKVLVLVFKIDHRSKAYEL